MSTIVKESCISLSGSIEIVVEYFGDSVCSILDQRGIYPRKYFKRMEKYGIPIFVADDAALKDFLKKYMEQVKRWLEKCDMRKLVLVILSQHTNEPLERWIFDVSLENDENSPNTKSFFHYSNFYLMISFTNFQTVKWEEKISKQSRKRFKQLFDKSPPL